MSGSGKVFIKPNIDNVLPYQQYLKSVTSFPSHIQPLLFAGGRKLMMQVRDTGNITQEELYMCVSTDGIENLNENSYDTARMGETLIDCDVFILDIGIIIWFNEWGYGMKMASESIFYHGVQKILYKNEQRDAYQMCLGVDKNDDYELMNILFGSCQMFGFKLHESNVVNNPDLTKKLYLTFTFVPHYKEFDRHYNEIPENLFFYEWFGINRGDKMIENMFSAVDHCLESQDSIQIENEIVDVGQDSYSMEFDLHSQEIINNLHRGIADDL